VHAPKITKGFVPLVAVPFVVRVADVPLLGISIFRKYTDLKYGTSNATIPRRAVAAVIDASPRTLLQETIEDMQRRTKRKKGLGVGSGLHETGACQDTRG
jgi:hypothetical protein